MKWGLLGESYNEQAGYKISCGWVWTGIVVTGNSGLGGESRPARRSVAFFQTNWTAQTDRRTRARTDGRTDGQIGQSHFEP